MVKTIVARKARRMETKRKRNSSFLSASGLGACLQIFLFVLVAIITIALVSCTTVNQRLIKYEVMEYQSIVDSIENSGSVIGTWRSFDYVLDNDSIDRVRYAPIFKDGKMSGSIQIRMDSMSNYNIKIIDSFKDE